VGEDYQYFQATFSQTSSLNETSLSSFQARALVMRGGIRPQFQRNATQRTVRLKSPDARLKRDGVDALQGQHASCFVGRGNVVAKLGYDAPYLEHLLGVTLRQFAARNMQAIF